MALKIKRVLETKGALKNFAELLGVSEKTLYNKLEGTSDFTFGEFRRLKTMLPEYNVEYLLEQDAEI